MTTSVNIIFDFNGATDWILLMKAFGVISLYAAAFASIMAIIATIFTDSGKTIGLLIMFFALVNPILDFIRSKLTSLETMIDHTVFMLYPKIFKLDQLDHTELTTFILIPILTFIALGILGSFIFRKKEIK